MKNLKNEKGAITLVVLVSMLFMLSFLMSAYMIVSNRAQKQREISSEIQQMYSDDQDLNVLYNSYINNEIIPIYTVEQLLKIGSGEQLLINNKYCTMSWSATYALMEDLEFDVSSEEVSAILGGNDWTPINNNLSFKGYFEGNGHTIEVKNKAGEIEIYSGLNNYALIRVGDIIQYTPASSYTVSAPYSVPAEYTGCTGTFYTDMGETIEWKVIGIEGNTIKIIPNAVSIGKLRLSGAHAWNNGIAALNNVCSAVYGNTESNKYTATARSMTAEDINKIAGYDIPESTTSYTASDYAELNTKANYFPIEYLKEKAVKEFEEADITNGYAANSDIIVEHTYNYYNIESEEGFDTKFAGWINFDSNYWLASTCVETKTDRAIFRLRDVETTGRLASHGLFYSTGGDITQSYSIRPVVEVTQKPNVSIALDKEHSIGSEINYWKFE